MTRAILSRLQLMGATAIGVFVLFASAALLFINLVDEIHEKATTSFDDSILRAIHTLSTPWLDTTTKIVTELGGILFVPAITFVIAVYLWRRNMHIRALLLVVDVAGAAGLNVLSKQLFDRQRPDLWTHLVVEHSFSFPSGHAMASSALAFGVILACWHMRRRAWIITGSILYIVAIAFTRMYLGVHYPTDILGGWLLSFIWVTLVWLIWKSYAGHTASRNNS